MPAVKFAIFLVFALASACSSDKSANLRGYHLSGRVVDDFSSSGLSGVRVELLMDTLYSASGSTDGDGDFSLGLQSDVPLGEVRATKSGYQTTASSVFFDTRERHMTLRLRPEPAAQ